jgi:hypothetical protein
LKAAQTVGTIAAGWDDLEESVAAFVDRLDKAKLQRLVAAVPTWSKAVIREILPLSAAQRQELLGTAAGRA